VRMLYLADDRETVPVGDPPTLSSTLRSWLENSLGFDARSLALLRIIAPSCYLWELLSNWPNLEACYTDSGLLPRVFVFQNGIHALSLYLAVGTLTGVRLLYLLQMAAVICVILGWRTRAASLVSWLFVISLQNRFPYLPGWETEVRTLFLVGAFLPWADYASLDARSLQARKVAPKRWVVSAATITWRVQVSVLYLASGLWKGGPGWADGTAVEVALSSDGYGTWLGHQFLILCRHFPTSLTLLSFAVPVFEILAGLWLMSPWPWLQFASVTGLWLMELGFGLCLAIDNFSLICSACLVCFIPSGFWNAMKEKAFIAPTTGRRSQLAVWQSVFLSWVSLSILISAFDSLPGFKHRVTELAQEPWSVLGLDQHWGMFVPPPFEGGWHVIEGRTVKGERIDLFHSKPGVSEDKPEWISRSYPNVRFYLFMGVYLHAVTPRYKYVVLSIADYYRRVWERSHPAAEDRIRECEIFYFQRVYEPGHGFKEASRIKILEQSY
jgi:hypothetical protein